MTVNPSTGVLRRTDDSESSDNEFKSEVLFIYRLARARIYKKYGRSLPRNNTSPFRHNHMIDRDKANPLFEEDPHTP